MFANRDRRLPSQLSFHFAAASVSPLDLCASRGTADTFSLSGAGTAKVVNESDDASADEADSHENASFLEIDPDDEAVSQNEDDASEDDDADAQKQKYQLALAEEAVATVDAQGVYPATACVFVAKYASCLTSPLLCLTNL